MKHSEEAIQVSMLHQESRPLRLLACSVLLFGTVVGGLVLVMWGFTYVNDAFFWGFREPGSEIGLGMIFVTVLISWMILRRMYSKHRL
jgi:hypothetical protein